MLQFELRVFYPICELISYRNTARGPRHQNQANKTESVHSQTTKCTTQERAESEDAQGTLSRGPGAKREKWWK